MKNKSFITYFIFVFYAFSLFSHNLYSEESKIDRTADPYGINEFSAWQKDLRRFEIISFGALPFVSLLSFWTYDIIRSIQHKGDPGYAPWPIKNPEKAIPLSESEQKKVLFSAIGISIGVAVIDLSIRAIRRRIERKRKQKSEEENVPAIELIPIENIDEYEQSLQKPENQNTENEKDTKPEA